MSIGFVGSRFSRALSLKYGEKNNKIVADTYGYTQQAIGKLKKKEVINETICIISEKEKINLNWLQTGEGEMFLGKDFSFAPDIEYVSLDTLPDTLISLPYFSETYGAMGSGAINYDDVPTPMSFDKDFLRMHLGITNYKNIHIINAIGDSMSPTISSGEILFINPFENESCNIADKGIYVIQTPNGTLVKRIRIHPTARKWEFISDNPDEPKISLTGDEFEQCNIVGRVVGHFDGL